MCGHLLDRVVRDVGDRDSGLPGRGEVNVVEPDPVAGDNAALLESGDGRGVPGEVGIEDPVGIRRHRQNFVDPARAY